MADESIMSVPAEMIDHFDQAEATNLIQGLRDGQDIAFEDAYLNPHHADYTRAQTIWNKLHSTAYPPMDLADKSAAPRYERPSQTATPHPNLMQVQSARTELDRLKGDADFMHRYLGGDRAALDTYTKLFEQAYPGDAVPDAASSEDDRLLANDANGLVDNREIDTTIPFKYGEDLSPEEIREQNALLVQDLAFAEKELGIPRDVADNTFKLIQASQEMRGHRPHDDMEGALLGNLLRDKWGLDFEKRQATVRANVKRLKNGELLAWNLQRVGPSTAAQVIDMLSQSKI